MSSLLLNRLGRRRTRAAALGALVASVLTFAATAPAASASTNSVHTFTHHTAKVVRTGTMTAAAPAPVRSSYGSDIGWPECPKSLNRPGHPTEGRPMPPSSTRFVVVGLTNGPSLVTNPCLGWQLAWAKKNHVPTTGYAVMTYPTASQLRTYGATGPHRDTSDWRTKLRNVGWSEAQFTLKEMRQVGMKTPSVFIDIEFTIPRWSKSIAANRAVIEGAIKAYKDAGLKVGVYSTAYQWAQIMGSPRYGLLEWHTTGVTSLTSARAACTKQHSFNGGPIVLAQWWDKILDHDVTCGSYSSTTGMNRLFTQY
ncbi:hypothetical protein [Terrabacter sp. BE26]|uniref:hypothetical protein n=1 Tax=Terrabacter sp. BE26 TaxID=2898152 RepID=UPI0035BE2904